MSAVRAETPHDWKGRQEAGSSERREAEALAARIHDFIAHSMSAWTADPGDLDRLLLAGFEHQVRWNPAYARYAAARGQTPETTGSALDIPPIPARAFGHLRLATFPPELTRRRFRSSGTTGGARAVLELDQLALEVYDAALLPAFRRALLPDAADLAWIALLPDPALEPESSLAYMVGSAARAHGVTPAYFGRSGGGLDLAGASAALAACARDRMPVLVLTTALALYALTGALGTGKHACTIQLPPGSRIMETGGFKGRRREVERGALYAAAGARLGVPETAIIGEYGMTEMVSQFYDVAPVTSRIKGGPPWVRTLVVDPVTLSPVGEGDEGILLHQDAAARSSAVALLTEDRARRSDRGFELLGRMPGAEARGCSLAFDELVRAGGGGAGDRPGSAAGA
jgi:Acyl-protein synthetase, LuxE